jgi:tetratricopeptide (TPR) repeat protein
MKRYDILKDEKNILLFLFVFSLIIRLVYLLEILNAPFTNHLYADPKLYNDFAGIFFSSGFWGGTEPISIPVLYPLVIFITKIFANNNFTLFILQSILGALATILIYLSAKNLFNKNIGLIASVISAIFAPYIFFTGLVSYEIIEIFLVSLFLFQISRIEKEYSLHLLFYSGLILGSLFLLRESYSLIILLFLIYIYFNKQYNRERKTKNSKSAGYFILGSVLPVLPVILINLIVSGSLIFNSTNSGINFNHANNINSKAIYISPSNFDYESDLSGKRLASNLENRSFTAGEAQSYWYSETLSGFFKNPIGILQNNIVKVFLLFDSNNLPASSNYDSDFYKSNFSELLKLPFMSYGAVALLALAGILIYRQEEKKNKFVFLFILGYIIIIFFSFANLRFRLGITPLFIILASFGIYQIVSFVNRKMFSQLTYPFIIVVVIVLISSFLIKKPGQNNYDAYFQFGKIAENEEKYEEAIYNFNRSILLNDKYDTFLNLGNTFAKKKDFNNALAAYGEAEKRNSEDYFLYFNKGIVLTQAGNYDEAIKSYQKSLELNPTHYLVYRNIGIIFYVNQNYLEAQKYFNRFIALSDDEETKALVRKDLENIRLKLQH